MAELEGLAFEFVGVVRAGLFGFGLVWRVRFGFLIYASVAHWQQPACNRR